MMKAAMGIPGGGAVVVTGAASGIGRAVAAAFHELGASVVAVDVDAAGLDDLRSRLGDRSRCVPAPADVSSGPQVAEAFARAAELGGCRVLVNAAGIGINKPMLDHEENDWDRVIGINLRGSFLCLQEAARQMTRQDMGEDGGKTAGRSDRGRIINIASVVGFRPGPIPEIAYDTSKGAVVQMTRSAALEMAPYGVRVNAVAPGPVPHQPLRNSARPTGRTYAARLRPGGRHRRCGPVPGFGAGPVDHRPDPDSGRRMVHQVRVR